MNTPAYGEQSKAKRRLFDKGFLVLCIGAASVAILVLIVLLMSILIGGAPRFGWDFITSYGSKDPKAAGIWPSMVGSIWLMLICAFFAIPLGVGTAVLLEEYKPSDNLLARLHGFVQLNITNLAGVPSIVYGILGITVFSTMALGTFQPFGSINNPGLTVGQLWYHEYQSEGGKFFYVPIESGNAEAVTATSDMTFYDKGAPGAQNVTDQVTIVASGEGPKAVIESANEALRKAIDASRPNKRGAAEIDQASAGAIVDGLFAAHEFQAEEAALRAGLVERLVAMNGQKGKDLRRGKAAITTYLEDTEFAAADVSGQIAADTLPQKRDFKRPWYFQLPFGYGVLAGGMTLMLVVLPVIIVASQEAIRAVPQSMRHGSLALGGTKWQAIAKIVLPASIPGICTGTILAMSRAIGEAAPIIIMGAVFITYTPGNLMDGFSAMPLQIFQWAGLPEEEFQHTAAAGIIVLLAVLLSFNAIAVFIRMKFQKPLS